MNSVQINQPPYPLQASDACSPICNRLDHGFVRKRTRATAEQLSVLEDTFSVNVSPNNKLRKKLSEQLNMSERSIQIWFQNRRAKVKHMQKKAQIQMQQAAICAQLYHYQMSSLMQSPTAYPYIRAQSADVLPSLTEPFIPSTSFYEWNDTKLARQSMPPQTEATLLEEFPETSYISSSPSTFYDDGSNYFSVSPVHKSLLDNKTFSISNTEADAWYYNTGSTTESTPYIHPDLTHFSYMAKDGPIDPYAADTDGDDIKATILTVGAWHRVNLNAGDLVCKFSPTQKAFLWHIEESLSRFKIIVPLSLITHIECQSDIQFHLSQPPLFYMQSNQQWIQCRDFTEQQQGSMYLLHTLKGLALKQTFADLADRLEEIKLLIEQPLLPSQNFLYK